MICPHSYCIVCNDRAVGRGGGIILLYKSNLQVVQFKPVIANECFEYICIDVHTSKCIIRFCCLYMPPVTANSFTDLCSVCHCLKMCISVKHCAYIVGDFNLLILVGQFLSALVTLAMIILSSFVIVLISFNMYLNLPTKVVAY